MNSRLISATLALSFALSGALAGCAGSPRVSFYTLSRDLTTPVPAAANTPSVLISHLTLPELVDRPQLVIRISESRIDVLETHRWAEPLKVSMINLLASNISARLGSSMVRAYPQRSAADPDYSVSLDILRFETVGETVSVDAAWVIRRSKDNGIVSGQSRGHSPWIGNGLGYEPLISAYHKVVSSIGDDIARAISADLNSALRKGDAATR